MANLLKASDYKKRPIEDILQNSLPSKSSDAYMKAWNEFQEFVGKKDDTPTETDFLQYIDYLHKEREYKKSSMWVK